MCINTNFDYIAIACKVFNFQFFVFSKKKKGLTKKFTTLPSIRKPKI